MTVTAEEPDGHFQGKPTVSPIFETKTLLIFMTVKIGIFQGPKENSEKCR